MQWAIPIVQGRIPISCRCITDLNLHLLLIPRSVYGCCFTQSLFAFIPRFKFPVSPSKSRHLQAQRSYVLDFISHIFSLHSHSTDDVHVFSMIFTVFLGQLNPTHRHKKLAKPVSLRRESVRSVQRGAFVENPRGLGPGWGDFGCSPSRNAGIYWGTWRFNPFNQQKWGILQTSGITKWVLYMGFTILGQFRKWGIYQTKLVGI